MLQVVYGQGTYLKKFIWEANICGDIIYLPPVFICSHFNWNPSLLSANLIIECPLMWCVRFSKYFCSIWTNMIKYEAAHKSPVLTRTKELSWNWHVSGLENVSGYLLQDILLLIMSQSIHLLNATQFNERIVLSCNKYWMYIHFLMYIQKFYLLEAPFLLKGIQEPTLRINFKGTQKY